MSARMGHVRLDREGCGVPRPNVVEMEDVTRQRQTFIVIQSRVDGTITCDTCAVMARHRIHKKHGHAGPDCPCTQVGPVTDCPHTRAAMRSGLFS